MHNAETSAPTTGLVKLQVTNYELRVDEFCYLSTRFVYLSIKKGMKKLKTKIVFAQGITLALCVLFLACEQEFNYRFKDIAEEEEEIVLPPDEGGYAAGDSLVFHENFQSWQREGYVNLTAGDCETDRMTTSLVMYVPLKPRTVTYNGFKVSYTLKDFAVNPVCGAVAGSSASDADISAGYVALQQLIFYECGQHDSDAMLQLSALPSVSAVRFSVSLGGRIEDVAGIALWVKAEDETAFRLLGNFIPADPQAGEVFTVEINKNNVQLKFIPALTGRENPVNDGINRAVRIHDLWVWRK
jgi:hypothetical protein